LAPRTGSSPPPASTTTGCIDWTSGGGDAAPLAPDRVLRLPAGPPVPWSPLGVGLSSNYVGSGRLRLSPDKENSAMRWPFFAAPYGSFRAGVIGLLVLAFAYLSMSVVPAGHVGVQDFFGGVSDRILSPGINLIVPGTRVIKFSSQTREMKETAAVPTSEGLVVNLDVSLLFRLQPDAAARVYRTIGRRFEGVVIDPQLRSVIRDVTAEY